MEMGAEGAGGSIQVVVGLSSRWPLTDTLIALLFIIFPLRYLFPVDPETAGAPSSTTMSTTSLSCQRDHLGERWAWPWSAFTDT